MYDIINLSKNKQFLDDFVKENVIANDRIVFEPFMIVIEEFISKHSGVIGNLNGTYIYLEKPADINSYSYDIYIENAFEKGKILANMLYDKYIELKNSGIIDAMKGGQVINPKTIMLETNLYHKLFTVYINGRALCKLYNMEEYRGLSSISLMFPLPKKGWFSKGNVFCICPDVQLLYLYQLAYRPYLGIFQPIRYNEIFSLIERVFNYALSNLNKKRAAQNMAGSDYNSIDTSAIAMGAGKNKWHKRKDHNNKPSHGKHKYYNKPNHGKQIDEKIIDKLLESIKGDKDMIVTGDYALKIFNAKTSVDHKERLQILAKKDIDDVKLIVINIVKSLGKNNLKVIYVKFNLNLPFDPFLIKYTFYVKDDRSQIPIFDMYNSLEYESMPYKLHDGIYYSGILVIMKFKLIEVYSLSLISMIERAKGNANENLIKNFINLIRRSTTEIFKLRDHISLMADKDILDVFPIKDYHGTCVDEKILLRERIKEQRRHPPYFPGKNASTKSGSGLVELTNKFGPNDIITKEDLSTIDIFFPRTSPQKVAKLKMNKEGIYSSTSINLIDTYVKHLRKVTKIDPSKLVILDATANMGSSALGFAKHFKHVIAVEIDDFNFSILKNNVSVYAYPNLEIKHNDIFNIHHMVKYDIAFIDPPWGGMNYRDQGEYELYLGSKSLSELLIEMEGKPKYIILKVPHNYNAKLLNKISKYNVIDEYKWKNILFIILSRLS